MTLIAILLYLTFTVLLALFGLKEQNQFVKLFFISLAFTPLVGFGYIQLSKKRNYSRMRYYHCPHCNFIFPAKFKYCPICEEVGVHTLLTSYKSPFKHVKKLVIPVDTRLSPRLLNVI